VARAGPGRALRRRRLPLPVLEPAGAGDTGRGGYRIDGWWDYGSGCDTATHFIGGVAVAGADSGPPADTRWAAFPRSAYEIVDNWDSLGMRGTGSWRVVVEDLFVPEHLTVPSPNPDRPVVDFPGRGVHDNPIYRGGAIMPLLVSEPAAVAVGIAQGAMTTTSRSCTRGTSTGRHRRCAATCRCSSATSARRRR
jgi:3-hydroxy-9,10-secoandrosta-1,3,5(10)-triene-9,17-dione monooxygenase